MAENRTTLTIIAKVLDEFSVTLGKMNRQVQKSLGDIKDESKKANTALAELSKGFKSVASSGAILQGVGISIGQALFSIPVNTFKDIASNITDATKAASEFNLKIAQIKTIAGKGGLNPEQLGDEALRLAGTFGQSAQVQASAFYNAVSSGIKETSTAMSLLDTSNRLATVGLASTNEAMTGLIGLARGFEHGLENVNDISDALFVTVDRGLNVTLTDLVRNIGFIGPAAHAVGADMDEMLAVLAAITNRGVATENAIIALNQVFTALQKPSKTAKDEAERLGIQFTQTALQSKGLIKFMQEIYFNTKLTEESIGNLFGNVRAMRGFFGAIIDGGTLANEIMEDMRNKTGRVAEGFEIISETTAFQIDRFNALGGAIEIAFGKMVSESATTKAGLLAINDALTVTLDLLIGIKPAKENIQELAKEFTNWIVAILRTTSALLDMLEVLSKFSTLLNNIKTTFEILEATADTITFISELWKRTPVPGVTSGIPGVPTPGADLFAEYGAKITKAISETELWGDSLDKIADKLQNPNLLPEGGVDTVTGAGKRVVPPRVNERDWVDVESSGGKKKKDPFKWIDAAMNRLNAKALKDHNEYLDWLEERYKYNIIRINELAEIELARQADVAAFHAEQAEYKKQLFEEEAIRQEEYAIRQKEYTIKFAEEQKERQQELTQSLIGFISGPFDQLFDAINASFKDSTIDIGKAFKKFIASLAADIIKSGILSLLGGLISVLTGGLFGAGLTGIFGSIVTGLTKPQNTGGTSNLLGTMPSTKQPAFIDRGSSFGTSSAGLTSEFGTSSAGLTADTPYTGPSTQIGMTHQEDFVRAERDTRAQDFLTALGLGTAFALNPLLTGIGVAGYYANEEREERKSTINRRRFGTTSSGKSGSSYVGQPGLIMQPVMMLPSKQQGERWFADVFLPLWTDALERGVV